MGCVFSKHFGDNNLRVFHVWNVDEQGNHLNPGKIEVTRNDLILHQKNKAPIRWPLRSLRRYGFDAELFSFESGRRCPTGQGIYAFKCRQAECLFNVLQTNVNIQRSVGPSGSIGGASGSIGSPNSEERIGSISGIPNSSQPPVASNPVPLVPGPNPLPVDTIGYLEPIGAATAAVTQASVNVSSQPRSSISSTSALSAVLIEPGSATISPARGSLPYSSSQPNGVSPSPNVATCSCAACTALNRTNVPHYINEEVFNTAATNNRPNTVCLPHQYVNSSVFLGEKVASQRNSIGATPSISPVPLSDLDHTAVYANGLSANRPQCPLSCPTPSCISYVDQNTNYARLDDLLKQEQQHSVAKWQKNDSNRFYVNVTPDTVNGPSVVLPPKLGRTTPTMSRSNTVTSPTGFSIPKSPVVHFYANLSSPPAMAADGAELEDKKEYDPDEPQVNYITLDLNHPPVEVCECSSPPANPALPSPPSSPYNNAEGYATIDFDKTAALSNSANPGCVIDDSIRKTRHNCPVPALQ